MFDLSNITLAFIHAHDAVQSFDAMASDMVQWHASGIYPSNKELIAALVAANRWALPTCKVYASNLLAWAKSGQVPRNISQVVKGKPTNHVKGNGGRPAGKGAGKTTKVDTTKVEAPSVPNEDKAWAQFIETMRAQVPGRKNWKVEDITAFQDCASKMLALLTRNKT